MLPAGAGFFGSDTSTPTDDSRRLEKNRALADWTPIRGYAEKDYP